MERMETSPNYYELAGKFGTPKITIAFMIKRHETWNPHEGNAYASIYETLDEKTKDIYRELNIEPYNTPISVDTESAIRRALELEYYDGLYEELYKISLLLKSAKTPTEQKEDIKRREMEILEFMKYDTLDEIKCLEEQSKQKKVTLSHPFLNYKMYFSRKLVIARLKLLKTKFLPK